MPMNPRLLRPVASGGFTPKKITGLQLWLDAADSSTITTGTGVSEWRDKSATGSKWVQATGNEQPATGTQTLNGKNVLVFDGSNDSLSASAPLSTSLPLTFFLVQRIVAVTSFGMSYTAGSGDNLNIRQNLSSGAFEISVAAGRVILDVSSRAGLNDVYSWTVPSGASSNSTLRRNGVELALTNPTFKPVLTGTHYIARRADGFYANIWMAEIIAYSTELSLANVKSVESYLGKKWGITVA